MYYKNCYSENDTFYSNEINVVFIRTLVKVTYLSTYFLFFTYFVFRNRERELSKNKKIGKDQNKYILLLNLIICLIL